MLFNSYAFIFAFLPTTFLIYFFLNQQKLTLASKVWLIAASLFFYSWWNIVYFPLIVLSVVVNYSISRVLVDKRSWRKPFLQLGLAFNLGLLGYFKYMDFFIANINLAFGTHIPLLHLALPLAISFYTLQQIAFLVDSYGGLVKERNFLDYSIFVLFFPQLIAGPIVHHKEMMPQFAALKNKVIDYKNIATGLYLFSIGLFKKVVIADTFAVWATAGHNHAETLNFLEAWAASLSYMFQLYFDFSGYTDMAIGAALLFNIRLPDNFNSPYKATGIIDFWQRWHMTLTRFITTYIYTPIVRSFRTFNFHIAMVASLIAMLISGFWHGSAWTFVLFGFLHGLAIVINHYFRKAKLKLNHFVAWFINFNFLNLTFVIFRAESMTGAIEMFKGMFGMHGFMLPEKFQRQLSFLQAPGVEFGTVYANIDGKTETTVYLVAGLVVVTALKNSMDMISDFKPTKWNMVFSLSLFITAVSMMSRVSEFLYFNF